MGKLYKQYLNLKQKDPEKIYIFKNGIFYICLDKDAKKLNIHLGLRLTSFDGNIFKCGFPANSLQDYLDKLNNLNINYQIIDNQFATIENPETYLTSKKITKLLEFINNINLDAITPRESYDILCKIREII